METSEREKARNKAQILVAKCQNMVQLCEESGDDGKPYFFVRITIGNNYFWIAFDELQDVVEQFAGIVNIKKGKTKYEQQ